MLILVLVSKMGSVLELEYIFRLKGAEFLCDVMILLQFGTTISAVEDLQVRPTDMQLNYASLRRGNLH